MPRRILVIIGHPEETWGDVWQSMKLLLRAAMVGCDDASVIMFCAYPGSKDFEDLVESGQLEMDEVAMYVGLSRTSWAHRSYNRRMPSKLMHLTQLVMLAVFYTATLLRRPRRILEHIRSIRSGRETTILDQLIRVKWRGFRQTSRW